jgi:pimeloyl-ACP methyl ester carboxylesterase
MIVHTNGFEMHCEVIGSGEPLLWLHGFLGAGADWRHMFPEPPSGFQLIAPDLRGHGASSNPAGEFRFRDAARDVAGLMEHLGVDCVKAIGVSGGGIALLHLAAAAPRAVSSMVLVSAPPYFPTEARALQRQLAESMFGEQELASMRARHRGGDPQLQELLRQGRLLADIYDDVNFTPPYLGTIAAETLIVFGDRDPLYPVSLAFELRSAIPNAHLWVVPRAGHAPVFAEHAPGFVEVALPFLRGERAA